MNCTVCCAAPLPRTNSIDPSMSFVGAAMVIAKADVPLMIATAHHSTGVSGEQSRSTTV